MRSTRFTSAPVLQEPFISPLPSFPQRNTGRSYSSANELATRPRRDGRQCGLPITITGESILFVLIFFFISFVIFVTATFLEAFIRSRSAACCAPSPTLFVESISNACIGSPIREAAFIRGPIMKPISSSVIVLWFTRIFRSSCCNPGRGDFRNTTRPKYAKALFSPVRGTISETVAMPAISSSHFSHPSGISKSPFFKSACANLNATPHPHRSLNGYVWSFNFGFKITSAGGSVF